MTNLQRLTGKIFGETATATGDDPQIGQFGSALAGTYVGTTDVATIQNLSAWSNGFIDSVTPNEQFPPLPEMTGFGKVLSHQYSYLLQKGIAEWDSETTYYTGDLCKGIGVGIIYESLIDNNINNSLTDTNSWKIFESNSANKELSNLSTDGNNRLHALKGYLDEGELLTDAEGLADVTEYAHSTFDSSKFTVAGSPTITSNGVVSNFDNTGVNGGYLTKSLTITLTNTSNIKIKGCFNSATSSANRMIFNIGDISTGIFLNHNVNGRLMYSVAGSNIELSASAVQLDTTYDYIAELKNGYLYFKYKTFTDNNYTEANPVQLTGTLNLSNSTLYIGVAKSTYIVYPFTGSIDLKQFSITVDGVPVFSGNKTGIDTIKPDDYTVVGTPTISADGVASNFSDSNYLYKNLTINQGSEVAVTICLKDIKVNSGSVNRALFSLVNTSDSTCFLEARLTPDNESIFWVYSNGATTRGTKTISYDYTGNSFIKAIYKNGSINIYSGNSLNSLTLLDTITGVYSISVDRVNFGVTYAVTLPLLDGSINLNAFKIYVNGDLVYQPCLKIPYTLSKTGSKIVDSYYRDRVSDMYTQFGYAPYYTLQENTNFTLPQGEIYGMNVNKASLDLVLPDYSAVITLSKEDGAAPDNGYLIFNSVANGGYELTIGGISLSTAQPYYNQDIQIFAVSRNVTYACNYWQFVDKLLFVPLKGDN